MPETVPPEPVPPEPALLDTELTDLDRDILELEQDWVSHAGAKDAAVMARFGMSPTDYHRHLTRIIDLPAAEAYAPRLVRRLRRQRSTRQEQRAARRIAG